MSGMNWDFIVIGGGPAGMMAAGRAAERGKRVLLLERGPSLGRKLLITAGGRCNVTNSAALPDFLSAFGRQGGFLRDALTRFGNTALLDWLHDRGVETVEFRNGCVFPTTQKADTVLKALTDYLAQGKVETRLNQRVQALLIGEGKLRGVRASGESLLADRALVATGGLSYPETGSSGDGYALARQAGHTLLPTYPAIIALETAEPWPKRVQGTPIKNVAIVARSGDAMPQLRAGLAEGTVAAGGPVTFAKRRGQELLPNGRKKSQSPSGIKRPEAEALPGGRKLAETFGEALWTHYGISGPAVFDISTQVVLALRQGKPVTLELDLRPNDTEDALDERLLFAIKKEGKKQIDNIVANWTAQRTATLLTELAGVEPRKKMSQCSKSDRRRIVRLVKHLELHITQPRPIKEAIVTGGGVALSEVDSKTMQSKLLPGLHFAGEVLDLAGPTGGYNLQAAFSTGYLAGERV